MIDNKFREDSKVMRYDRMEAFCLYLKSPRKVKDDFNEALKAREKLSCMSFLLRQVP